MTAIWMGILALAVGAADSVAGVPQAAPADRALADEVRDLGWIAYAARSDKGDWDIFVCRPDGSQIRSVTGTPEHNEFSPQFSRDGRRLLYRRMPRTETIDNNHHGTQGALVLANSDGTHPQVFGDEGEYTWASWSPDGKQLACLSIKGITFIDVATHQNPSHAGAPMGLLRLRDAPLIGGASRELRNLHPQAGDGPVLTLPVGWEPCWTSSELPAGKAARSSSSRGTGFLPAMVPFVRVARLEADPTFRRTPLAESWRTPQDEPIKRSGGTNVTRC